MKIAIFVHCFPPAVGGLEFLAGQIKKSLDKEHQVYVFTGEGKTLDSYKTLSNWTREGNPNVFRIELNNTLQKTANKLFNKLVLKFTTVAPWYFGPILKYSKKYLDIIKDVDLIIGMGMPTKSFFDSHKFSQKYNKKLILIPAYHDVGYFNNCYFFKKALTECQKIIFLSSLEKTLLYQNYPDSQTEYQILHFSPFTKKEILNQRNKFQNKKRTLKNSNSITLGYVGQIVTRKNLKLFANYLNGYLKYWKNKNIQLNILLAGAKTNSSHIVEQQLQKYLQNDTIKITYDFKNKKEIYDQIDIFINPSSEESFGIVNQEAIFYNLPTLVNSNSAFAEYLDDSWCFSNTRDLHQRLTSFIDDSNINRILGQQHKLLDKFTYKNFEKSLGQAII